MCEMRRVGGQTGLESMGNGEIQVVEARILNNCERVREEGMRRRKRGTSSRQKETSEFANHISALEFRRSDCEQIG